VDQATKPTLLFAVWLIAYVTIGGAGFLISSQVIERTTLDGLLAIVVSAAVTIVLAWLAASWVQRRVAARLDMPGNGPPVA
jgi:hypothetical protein